MANALDGWLGELRGLLKMPQKDEESFLELTPEEQIAEIEAGERAGLSRGAVSELTERALDHDLDTALEAASPDVQKAAKALAEVVRKTQSASEPLLARLEAPDLAEAEEKAANRKLAALRAELQSKVDALRDLLE